MGAPSRRERAAARGTGARAAVAAATAARENDMERLSPHESLGKFLRIERDGSPGRCGARRSGRGSFERVVRVRSVGDGARKSLGTACAPDSAPRADVASFKNLKVLFFFFPGNGRDLRVTSLTRIPKFGISLTVNNRWRRCANGSGLDRDSRLFQPRETIGQKRKIRAICSAFSNAGLSKLPKQSDFPTQHNTHTRTPSNARVVTSDGVERR